MILLNLKVLHVCTTNSFVLVLFVYEKKVYTVCIVTKLRN